MSTPKIVTLLVYAVLAALAITQGGTTPLGVWSLRILAILAAAHAIEMVVFFKLCKQASGSLAGNLINVFLFGVIHAGEMKKELKA